MSESPASPKAFSSTANFTRHSTSHTAAPTTGTHRYGLTLVASCRASATPPISAMKVSSVTAIDATRLARPIRGPSRSRTRSKVARPETAATRPLISAKTQIPTIPTMTTQPSDIPNREPT